MGVSNLPSPQVIVWVSTGLTGKQLCQSAWNAAFDAFGLWGDAEDSTVPLLVVAIGSQPDALDEVQVPKNAKCYPYLPQVEILKAKVDLFLTHGGQNSFMESLMAETPVVVCPGFADQIVNAMKADPWIKGGFLWMVASYKNTCPRVFFGFFFCLLLFLHVSPHFLPQ